MSKKNGTRPMNTPALTPKQQAFAREYSIDLNASAAAVRAGYSANGANRQGSNLLSKPEVKALVDVLMAERAERVGMTADDVLEGLATISRECMSSERWNPAAATKALELIGRHVGLWPKNDNGATPAHVTLSWAKPIAELVTPEMIDAELDRLEHLMGGNGTGRMDEN